MMAARRLRGLGRIMLTFLVAIACYLVSVQVASERNRLDAVNTRIAAAHREIRQLETEVSTRASLRQLERWNGEVLALSAPGAAQFVRDERQLAAMDFDARPEAEGQSPAMLALVSPATAEPVMIAMASQPAQTAAPSQPVAPQRTAAAATPQRTAAATTTPIIDAIARAVVPEANAAPRAPRPAAPRRTPEQPPARDPVLERQAAADTRRAQRVAMLETKLLGDDVLRDIGRTARAEAGNR